LPAIRGDEKNLRSWRMNIRIPRRKGEGGKNRVHGWEFGSFFGCLQKNNVCVA
jgi:hypothetical protein